MNDDELLPAGTLLAGKLRVVRALGAGGMGTVYEVEHELTRHRRALKLLHADVAANQQAVQRFLREASAAGRIGSPHIVEAFDAGTLETGEPYLLMEMLQGESLADKLSSDGRIPETQAIEWVAQACDGVQAAHDAGIVHRDLKPDNLFIEKSGRVKILDFGISKFDPERTGELQLTRENLAMGTPYYMAPEQTTASSRVDQRVDVYALGVVLYEAITGRKPFDAETFPQLVVRIHLGEYQPASSVSATSHLLDRIIAKAMARKPDERFQTARDLAAELRELARGTERAPDPFAAERAIPIASTQPRPDAPTVGITPQAVAGLAATEQSLDVQLAQIPPAPVRLASEPPAPMRNPSSPPAPLRTPSGRPVAQAASGAEGDRTLLSAELSGTKSGGRAWLGVPVLLALAAFGAFWLTRAPSSTPSATPSASAASVTAEALSPSHAAAPALPVALASSAPAPTPEPEASAASKPAAQHPAAPASSKSKDDSRAATHHLEEQNPFK